MQSTYDGGALALALVLGVCSGCGSRGVASTASTTGGGSSGAGGSSGSTRGSRGLPPELDAGDDRGGAGGSAGGTGGTGAGGTGGMGGSGGSTEADGGSTETCFLSVTVTTASANGQYAPRNVGAIWIATDTGAFVKTLARWAGSSAQYVVLWNSVTQAAGVPRDVVDAVTSATSLSHQSHKLTWNCTDFAKGPVADGVYRVYFEFNEGHDAGPNSFVTFAKGPTAATVTYPDTANFKSISLVFTP